MTSASGHAGEPGRRSVGRRLGRVFALDSAGFNWPRAVLFLDIALVPLVVFWAIGHEQYLLSALFGLLFSWLADPGGGYGSRAARIAAFGLVGGGLTALAFGIGGVPRGWLVLAAFLVTLVGGLTVVFGVRRFVDFSLLNVWFILASGLAVNLHHHVRIPSHTWAQLLAWVGGSGLWVAMTFVEWLIRGRTDQPQPIAELPADTSRRTLTAPIILFAVARALAVAGAVALAFGLSLPHGYWLPVAAIIALKPSLEQSTLMGAQRLAGTFIGAIAAALVLLIPNSVHGLRLLAVSRGLEVVALVLLMHAVAIRFWNYAFYTAAIAAGVLILVDLPEPSNYATEGYRLAWTACGVAIALAVTLLAAPFVSRTSKSALRPSTDG